MRINYFIIFLWGLTSICILSCKEESKPEKKWYKGNLHTHSYWSDGDEFPEMIMDWYKTHNYDFIALSDHNIFAEGEKWITVTKSKLYEEGFQNYLQKYGEEWVKYKIDSGRTHVQLKTLAEYRPLFEDDHFLIIKSEEISDGFEGKPLHLNATNVQQLIKPQGGQSVADVLQRNMDAVLKQREETGIPMFPHINHPNFHFAISAQDMIALKGERFFEVHNGHPAVYNYGDSAHTGIEQMWDMINIAYRKRQQPLLFGLATDDTHNYHEFGSSFSNSGRGWVMVQADSLTPSSLVAAMEAGKFYASTGVTLEDVAVENNEIKVKVVAQEGVNYKIQFIGVKKGENESHIVNEVSGTEGSFSGNGDFLFVRAKIISDKLKVNPFQEGDFEAAWTQPVEF
ncbi:MAG TPA: histidinol-phosphatase [Cyclobacteriaceae bacterium]|nr:histidinol-phosphatase [Cyclobacteriaceae bacterium]